MRDHMHESDRDPTMIGHSAPRLRALSRLDDFEVADGDPDIRRWQVFDAAGNVVGIVHDLIIDLATMQARYIDLRLGPERGTGEERHVLVPIGIARLHGDIEALTLTTLDSTALAVLPTYDHSVITRDRECELQGAVRGQRAPIPDTGSDFYDQPEFVMISFWSGRGGGTRDYVVAPRNRNPRR